MPEWTPGGGLHFQLLASSGRARRGRFVTAHGVVDTPAFMPVGTQAAVKCVLPDQLAATGAQVVLANTYHLGILDRTQVVERLGGLHKMMRWNQTILTDSGGFQVFSLPEREITEEGVSFQFRTGKKNETVPMMLSPETAMDIQRRLGADIVMAFDECVDHRAPKSYMAQSLERTLRWLKRCAACPLQPHQHLFGIVQGGMEMDLRSRAVRQVTSLNLPGYAIGGVSVGEGHEAMVRVVRHTAPLLPADQVRYLMGVGLPEDLVASVRAGMDIHDCIIPTRYAREGTVFCWDGKMRLQDKKFRKDRYPIDTSCECVACAGGFSRAYLRHLLFADEPLYGTLASIHNLHFYQDLMRAMRKAIEDDCFERWADSFLERYLPNGGD
ncbi:MAG: tRNA guanosine(34) transglycosylase Tgt [Planctomyces sp.]|nr:tRNA guanosine(34) transglycosylase Tgt [Planctomyces sp.]